MNTPGVEENENQEEDDSVQVTLNLPYAGKKGEYLVKKLRKYITKTVNKRKKVVNVNAVYRSKRLGASFNVKDKIKLQHQHNVVYHARCPNKRCKSEYTGETKCRIGKRGD